MSFAALLLGFTQSVLETGITTLQRIRGEQERAITKVQWMYQMTFAVGVISFLAAVYKAFTAETAAEAWPSRSSPTRRRRGRDVTAVSRMRPMTSVV